MQRRKARGITQHREPLQCRHVLPKQCNYILYPGSVDTNLSTLPRIQNELPLFRIARIKCCAMSVSRGVERTTMYRKTSVFITRPDRILVEQAYQDRSTRIVMMFTIIHLKASAKDVSGTPDSVCCYVFEPCKFSRQKTDTCTSRAGHLGLI